MNTIIYLYHGREAKEFVTEKWQEEDYCLIRLGIPSLLWQNLKRSEAQPEQSVNRDGQKKTHEESQTKLSIWQRVKSLYAGRRKKESPNQNIAETNNTEKQQDNRREQLAELLEELREMQIALALLGDNPYWTYCVYEDILREKVKGEIWQHYWEIPEFDEYHEYIWVRKLMPYSIPGSYIILGYADCLPQVLCENAGKMRSVRWFLRQKQYTRDIQDFVEEFFEEYGLAIEVRLWDEEWIRVRPASAVPVNVLDFTREEKMSACDVADGSIWLDMDSMDGKNRRIEVRNPKVSYVSLKKQWKQRQKEGFYLDTLHKNGYNT